VVLALLVAARAAESPEALDHHLAKEEALVVLWSSLPTAAKATKKICFVEDASLGELARVTSERGHEVFFARFEGSWSPLTMATVVITPYQKQQSRFGAHFDRSLSVYHALKDRHFDAIVFASDNGLAYMCEEAKRAGLAFENTALVVRLGVTVASGDSYSERVTRFMTRQAVSLADSVFTTVADRSVLWSMKFYQRVTAWLMEGGKTEEKALSLIESVVLAAKTPAATPATPLVTCIVTSFNRPEMLRAAVQSLQKQTYGALELIVVDDGSTAAGMETVLSELEASKVVVVRQPNQYLGAARNNGARIAKGEYLLFLDDDNIALPGMVATLVKAVQHSNAVVAVNAHYNWEDSATIPADLSALPVWCPVGPAVEAGLKGNVFGNANFLISKATFYSLSGFSEDRAGWEDYEFHAKSAIAGVEYVTVPEPLMLYRHHSFDQMSKTTDSAVNAQRVMRAYSSLLDEVRGSGGALREFDERIPTQCTITAIGFTQNNTVSGQVIPVCSSVQLTIVVVDNGVPDYLDYLNAGVTPSVTIGGVQIPAANLVFNAYPAAPGVGSRNTFVVTLTGNPPGLVFASGTFSVTASVNYGTGSNVACTGVSTSPYCQIAGTCFHKDSTIAYKGERLTLTQLRRHAECAIPHEVVADGVRIETACDAHAALRLTPDHLVFAAAGLVPAGAVRVGDVVFGDEAQRVPCKVTRVTGEKQQTYFGLNCLHSVVLADGIKVCFFLSCLSFAPSLTLFFRRPRLAACTLCPACG
jgi:GT2 family glycosyltransferase